MRPGKRFAIGEPDQKLQGRPKILQHADGGEPQTARSDIEQDQWRGGDNALADQQRPIDRRKLKRLGARHKSEQKHQGKRRDEGDLQRKAGGRIDRQMLADQGIGRKRPRQPERHPRRAAQAQRQNHDARPRQTEPQRLHGAQALAQEHNAKGDIDQRIKVIAKAGFQDAVDRHRPQIHAPIGGDQRSGQHEDRQTPPIADQRQQGRPSPHDEHKRQSRWQGPHHAMRSHQYDRQMAHEFQIDRQ